MIKPGELNRYNPEQYNNFTFDNDSVRKQFIAKVFSIVGFQLLFSAAIIAVFLFNGDVKDFVIQNPYLFWVAMGAIFVTLIMIACCDTIRRTFPINYILLAVFTIAESFTLGIITLNYEVDYVILALAITAVVVFALTIFAMQTKIDFTTCGGMLLMFIVILIIMGVVLMYFPDRVTKMAYVCFGVFCFGLYLVYDVQLMVGGSHAYAISPEEYVFAALSIYIDIINIFMYILALFGMSNDK
ncbi:protein lifeguard 1-like isoform X1 [Teleopsis dalmanni]|uniref:protein lifeguard 1-like isoform X1 n=1 Tax=Teleopsis dalmanni TaxID=139649 RepID=UPI0018CEF1B4|nr:protein lifeguard 1-like isoform X1 [Teleopsis dalmanni]